MNAIGDVHTVLILHLPVELLSEILKHLDLCDLVNIRAVCVTFRDVVQQSLELQYKIELAADGMVDGLPGLMSTAERLQLLLERRRAWRRLDWKKVVAVPIRGACQAYELVGGVFAKTMAVDIESGSRHLVASWLPSQNDPGHTIVQEDLGLPTRDFAIDPTQDLIALVDANDTIDDPDHFTVKVFLRTLTTNKPHPAAAVVELQAPVYFTLGSSFIQIVDDVVGFFFWVHGPGLIIWNWRTGEMLVYSVSEDLPQSAWDFTFLSSRAFLVTTVYGAGTLNIYTFGGTGRPSSLPDKPTLIATLTLPELQSEQTLNSFSTHSSPFIGRPIKGKPFMTALDFRVHLMSLQYGERGPRYHLFVNNRFFLKFVHEWMARRSATPQYLDWVEWGPMNTRLLRHNVQFQWLRYVHGSRIVNPPSHSAWHLAEHTLTVIDFNVHPKRLDDPVQITANPSEDEDADIRYEVFSDSTRIPAENIFREDVVTSLPYSKSTRGGKFNYSGFMIDDERIVGMKTMAFAEGDMSDVDVFTF